MRRVALTAAVLAAAAVFGAACGGELSKEEYGAELRTTMNELEDAYGNAQQETAGGTETPGDADRLREQQVALRDAGNRLEEIDPPSDLSDEHGDLVGGVRDLAGSIDLLIEATEVAETDPERAKELTRRFASNDSFLRVGDAAARLDRAGVDAGL